MPRLGRLKVLAALAPLLVPLAPFQGAAAGAYKLAPHKAIYKVTLQSARRGSGIVAVVGEMFAEWAESCDGWTMDHRSLFDITYAQGQAARITSTVATWESRDGLEYHFDVRNLANGKPTETIAGRATLTGPGRRGSVTYTAPRSRTVALPAGTVFPTVHSGRVLEAAARAPTIVSMTVFDGLSEEGPLQVNAVIGRPISRGAPPAAGAASLRGRRSWPLHMAFFRLGSADAVPEQEYAMRMFDNGVGDDLVLDFGEFRVSARLVTVEVAEKPSCGA